MRTTLTIDDGITRELKEIAHRTGRPFKDVVNETLRAGLGASRSRKAKQYRLRPARLGRVAPGTSLDKALALASAIEDEEIARKLDLRK